MDWSKNIKIIFIFQGIVMAHDIKVVVNMCINTRMGIIELKSSA